MMAASEQLERQIESRESDSTIPLPHEFRLLSE